MSEFLYVFISGIFFGATLTCLGLLAYGSYIRKKKRSKIEKFVNELKKAQEAINSAIQTPSDGSSSVKERLKKVREITTKQLELQAITEQPQKNSLDGKYKNSLNKEVKELEEEKETILRSIINDGHDPIVSTLSETGDVEMIKLSELMIRAGFSINKEENKKETVSRKFTVLDGGANFDSDDDNSGTTH